MSSPLTYATAWDSSMSTLRPLLAESMTNTLGLSSTVRVERTMLTMLVLRPLPEAP